MKRRNIILITLDEVRPDHLSCYGYKKIRTENIDVIACQGVIFDTCIAVSDFTPICHASLFCGVYPNVHGVRDPYSYLQATSIAEILKEEGYKTAGFVGSGILGSIHGFNKGFEFYDEPKEGEEVWERHRYPGEEKREMFIIGNWWIPKMLDWIKANSSSNLFVWGHFYDTHEGSQEYLLEQGKLKDGELSDFFYYDAKIKLADREVVGPLIETLRKQGIYDETTIIIMSDHGTTMGEHPAKPVPWRVGVVYPQHTNMWDTDLRVSCVMKGEGLPEGKHVHGMVRSIDIAPTLLELCRIKVDIEFDGTSLLPFMESGESRGLVAYAEDLFERRGPGALQAIRTDNYKYMRNLTENTEGLYNLLEDPGEQRNLQGGGSAAEQKLVHQWRMRMNETLWQAAAKRAPEFSKEDKKGIEARLRALGYVE